MSTLQFDSLKCKLIDKLNEGDEALQLMYRKSGADDSESFASGLAYELIKHEQANIKRHVKSLPYKNEISAGIAKIEFSLDEVDEKYTLQTDTSVFKYDIGSATLIFDKNHLIRSEKVSVAGITVNYNFRIQFNPLNVFLKGSLDYSIPLVGSDSQKWDDEVALF
ncbi:hypothetical protein B0G81_7829 [Paraburkholderia sp. BL6665CI2N2]|uniref:hypothetical protein n=1 Tax=Paraburkholderia sp. BL6665CI2N2 TaxID=1938806 RepID=UPI0010661C6A|nr:hypothetical protein [Paraburkholderia sp. BL6665CI2N2]TDY16730.1 hypothetical protein B0G81_7829 [Paraburkholderia sp. BL6665CI2N2]